MSKTPHPPCASSGCGDRACCAGEYRYEWPETVGMDAEEAMSLINESNPYVTVVKIDEGVKWPADFCCNRVYLLVGRSTNKVVSLPMIG